MSVARALSIRSPRLRCKPRALALAAAALVSPWAASPVMAAACTWNPVSGNWGSSANWSCGTVPGNADSATIGAGKTTTINAAQQVQNLTNAGSVNIDAFLLTLAGGGGTTNTGTINVGAGPIPNNAALNVSAGHNINNTGGVINISADSVLNQFGSAITGGTINTTGSGKLVVFSSTANFLNGVTLNGTMDMASNANSRQRVTGGLTLGGTVNLNGNGILSFEGTQTLGGTGSIVFGNTGAGNRLDLDGSGTTTFASGVTVRGHTGTIGLQSNIGGTQTLVNNGTISADVAGGTITITESAVTNNGTLSALNGGTLVLNSNVTGGGTGQIVAGAGSTVLQNGVTIGGTVNTSGSGLFTAISSSSNFLTGVTLNGNLDMASLVNSRERVSTGGLVLNGTININNNGILSFEGDGTLSGSATIVLGATGAGNRIDFDGNGTTTFASGVTVRGENGSIGNQINISGTQTLVNNGTISADVAGGTINITESVVINNNLMEARNGATLNLTSNVSQGASGVIRSGGNGGIVQQSGVRITGGTIDGAPVGQGAFLVTGSAANFLDGATTTGHINMASIGSSRERVVNGLTHNGTLNLNQGGILSFEGTQTLSGTGSIVFGNTGAGNRIDLDGNGTTTVASGITIRGHSGSIGNQNNISGTQTLVNNGTVHADTAGGTITFSESALVNNGLVRASAGTVNVNVPLSGTGTLQVDAAGAMILAAGAKTQGQLVMGAAGAAINLNTGDLTITSDYTNAGAGAGNAFNRRAGVTGTGLIVAAANAAQAITGAGVTNGATTNATLTIGNVRVGAATTFNYQIANTGTTGPTLRGAIQTTANGASLNDARLSGSGVAASNYSTGAPGNNSGNLAVTFTPAAAGLIAPLVNQKINLTSNFSNIADQKLNIVTAAGAGAYVAATGQLQAPTTFSFGTLQIGQNISQNLVVRNNASGPAGFVEDLNAQFGSITGAGAAQVSTNGGAFAGILAGTNSTGANGTMTVTVTGATLGAINTNVGVNYITSGMVNGGAIAGLSPAASNSEVLNVLGNIITGNVVNQADPVINNSPIALGNVRIGTASPVGTVNVTNHALGGQQAALNASIATAGAPITASGSFNQLLPGNSSPGQAGIGTLQVGMNTSTAGPKNGNATVSFVSDATNIGGCAPNCALNLASQNVAVNGAVYRLANPTLNTTTVTIAARVGDSVAANKPVSITNTSADIYTEGLKVGISGNGGNAQSGGAIANLAAAGNSSAILVGLASTATAGNTSGTVNLGFISTGVGTTGAADIAAQTASGVVNVNGHVYTPAVGQRVTTLVDFGVVRVGDTVTAKNITVNNTAATSALNDTLTATLSGVSGPFTPGAPASGIAAGAGGLISVGLNTGTAGINNQTGTVGFASHNAEMSDITVGTSGAVSVKAQINNLANAQFDFLSGLGVLTHVGSDYLLELGNVVLGSNLLSQLDLSNFVTGPADDLSGAFNLAAADDFTYSGWGAAVGPLGAGQATASLAISWAANALGSVQDTIVFNGRGTNASDPTGLAQTRRLTIHANVINAGGTVPEPGTLALILLAALSATVARRRQAH